MAAFRTKHIVTLGQSFITKTCRIVKHMHNTSSVSAEWSHGDPFYDPLRELQPLLQIPLFREGDMVFNPTQEELARAQTMFKEQKGQPITSAKGVVDLEQLPNALFPEVNGLATFDVLWIINMENSYSCDIERSLYWFICLNICSSNVVILTNKTKL